MAIDYSRQMNPVDNLNNYENKIPKLFGIDKDNHAAILDVGVIAELASRNFDGIPSSWVDTNDNLGNSDQKIPTQRAIKAYVDAHAGSGQGGGIPTSEGGIPTSWVDTNVNLGISDNKIPTQKAVKTYVDAHAGSGGNGWEINTVTRISDTSVNINIKWCTIYNRGYRILFRQTRKSC